MENNVVKPITLIRRYAEYTKEKFEFLMEFDAAGQCYTAELNFGHYKYKGKGSSKEEARNNASLVALRKLAVPDFLRNPKYRQKDCAKTIDIPNETQMFKYNVLRNKRLSSLNRRAYQKGYRKIENLATFYIKSEGSRYLADGFTSHEAKRGLKEQLYPTREEDHVD